MSTGRGQPPAVKLMGKPYRMRSVMLELLRAGISSYSQDLGWFIPETVKVADIRYIHALAVLGNPDGSISYAMRNAVSSGSLVVVSSTDYRGPVFSGDKVAVVVDDTGLVDYLCAHLGGAR